MAETFSQGNVPWWTNPQRILLAKILNAIGGGGGGSGGVSCGAVDPVAAPSGTCGIYFNTAAGSLWAWNGVAWLPLVV